MVRFSPSISAIVGSLDFLCYCLSKLLKTVIVFDINLELVAKSIAWDIYG